MFLQMCATTAALSHALLITFRGVFLSTTLHLGLLPWFVYCSVEQFRLHTPRCGNRKLFETGLLWIVCRAFAYYANPCVELSQLR